MKFIFNRAGLGVLLIVVALAGYIQPAESVDTVPPVTTCTLDGTGGPTTYTGPVTITLTATDADGSGVWDTYWDLDVETHDIIWVIYTGPFKVAEPGSHTLKYCSEDKAGNHEAIKSTSFTIVLEDDPMANINLTGMLGEGGVYVSPVTVKLTATDNCSGVWKTLYSLDGGTTWQTYASPFNISAEGNTTVRCYSVDNSNNIGNEVSQTFTISTGQTTTTPTVKPSPSPSTTPMPGNDTTPPVTVVALNGKLGNGANLYTSDVQVILVANDGTGSGVNRTMIRLNNDSWKWYSSPFYVVDEGVTTVYYYSVDNAGNTEATNSKTFAVAKQSKLPCCGALVLPLLCVGVLALGAVGRRKNRR